MLDHQLGELEQCVAHPDEEQAEIADVRRRYQDLCRRLDAGPPDAEGALQEDYEALVDSVGHWIARQDANNG
jgi:hypothetical protein